MSRNKYIFPSSISAYVIGAEIKSDLWKELFQLRRGGDGGPLFFAIFLVRLKQPAFIGVKYYV